MIIYIIFAYKAEDDSLLYFSNYGILFLVEVRISSRDSLVVAFFGNGKEVMLMNTMEVLTLLLVVFAALSYIDDHRNK